MLSWKTEHLGKAAHLNRSFHIVDMLGMGVVDRQPILGTEQQVFLHCQVGIHDVILQHTGTHPHNSIVSLTYMRTR